MEVDSEGRWIQHDMCTQQLEALNVEVEGPLPSPNPLFLLPMVHLENKGGNFTMMPIRVNNITSRQQHLQILCGVLWTQVKMMPKHCKDI
jgi:hypothetical protein